MKTLLTIALAISCSLAFSQNCKYDVENFDPIKKTWTAIGKEVTFGSSDIGSYDLGFSMSGKYIFLTVKVSNNLTMSLSIEEGDPANFLFTGGEELEMKVSEFETTDFGYGSSSVSHNFLISEEVLQKFAESDLMFMSMSSLGTAERKKERNSLKIREAAGCLLSKVNALN